MKRYLIEVRVREAGDAGDALPVQSVLELPTGSLRLQHRDVASALHWALAHLMVWQREHS